MLNIIDQSFDELLENDSKRLNETERLEAFLESHKGEFTRKDYIKHFHEISTATASKDLKNGFEKGLIEKSGDKKTTCYKFVLY